jgi:BRO family, N-terminal domain
MWCVSESGLYHLVFTSRKAEAKAFRRWVTDEVLPSIRKTGSYSVHQEPVYFNKQTQERCRLNEKLLPKGYWNVETEMVGQACTLQALQKELKHWCLPSGSGGMKWINHLRKINHPLLAQAKKKCLHVPNLKNLVEVWIYPYALLEYFREWLRVEYAEYYEHEYSPSRLIGAEQIGKPNKKRGWLK